MNILVLLKMVPDVVEELEIAPDGKSLDASSVRMILSERDDHALEEALLLKERYGGTVTVLALEAPEIDEALFTALAKGADRAIKISGAGGSLTTSAAARLFSLVLPTVAGPADLILTGVQAIDDLDGLVAPILSRLLGLPYMGVVTAVKIADKTATVVREYAGGVRGEFEVPLPAVLGIQSAEQPPRYVPVAKVRAAMKSQKIESIPAPATSQPALVEILQMTKPQVAGRAEILEGSPEEVAGKICEILVARGLLQKR
jgi:electron transfer flavoprotein beta subunit